MSWRRNGKAMVEKSSKRNHVRNPSQVRGSAEATIKSLHGSHALIGTHRESQVNEDMSGTPRQESQFREAIP